MAVFHRRCGVCHSSLCAKPRQFRQLQGITIWRHFLIFIKPHWEKKFAFITCARRLACAFTKYEQSICYSLPGKCHGYTCYTLITVFQQVSVAEQDWLNLIPGDRFSRHEAQLLSATGNQKVKLYSCIIWCVDMPKMICSFLSGLVIETLYA